MLSISSSRRSERNQSSPLAALALRTSIHYFSLIIICLNDLAVLVFFVGTVVVGARWMGGGGDGGGVVEGIKEVVEEGWNAARGEL